MITKFGQFIKLKCREGSQLCKLSKLCYHFFLSSFENENNFFLISRAIPCPPPFEIYWQINFTKTIDGSVYFQQQLKKITNSNLAPEKTELLIYEISGAIHT